MPQVIKESNTSNSIIPVKTFIKDFIEKPISLSWYEVTQLFQYLLHYHSQADLEKIGASLPPQHEWLTFAKEYLYSAQTIEWVTTKVPDS